MSCPKGVTVSGQVCTDVPSRHEVLIEPIYSIFSDGWAKDDLIYKWKEKDPVQIVKDLHLPRFTLEQYKSAYCDVKTNTGK